MVRVRLRWVQSAVNPGLSRATAAELRWRRGMRGEAEGGEAGVGVRRD